MKPSRCRVMCPDCGKQKMQFETESEAKRFIQYNGQEISNEPENLRVYYCPSCCCYHISSKKKSKWFDNNTNRLLKAYNQDTGKKKRDVVKDAQEKATIIKNIHDIVVLEPSIKITKTGVKHVVSFTLSSNDVFGLDKDNNQYPLIEMHNDELTCMLTKLCEKHFLDK